MPDPARADELLGFLTLMGGGAFIGIGSGAINVEVSGRAILVVAGAFLELVGLGFGVYPDVVPTVRRFQGGSIGSIGYSPSVGIKTERRARELCSQAVSTSSTSRPRGTSPWAWRTRLRLSRKRRPRLSMMSPPSRLNSRHCRQSHFAILGLGLLCIGFVLQIIGNWPR